MRSSHRWILPVLLLAVILPTWSQAENIPLNRQEVTVIKNKLKKVIDALGQPPAGYVKKDESFDLPTSASTMKETGLYHPIYASAQLLFDGGDQKQDQKNLEAEYKRKILEAQASGNYNAIAEISQEMMKKMGELQLAAENSRRDPVNISLRFNSNPSTTIDPDAVVFENPGVIALKSKQTDADKLQIMIFYDPVKLKETQTLASFDLNDSARPGISDKTIVHNITIEFDGPSEIIEDWSKQVANDDVLAQIKP